MYQPFDRQQHFFTRVFENMKTPTLSETGMIVAAKKVKFNFHVAVEKLDLLLVSFSFFFFFFWLMRSFGSLKFSTLQQEDCWLSQSMLNALDSLPSPNSPIQAKLCMEKERRESWINCELTQKRHSTVVFVEHLTLLLLFFCSSLCNLLIIAAHNSRER